ncbi:Na/Pi-cotransporter [Methylorubrum populi]|uniref:Na/Pi-cotransporter n=1 Tax=Methylorubrum populi TaxID=223967 RepID=A0A169RG37_9HYPH|nr:hypothetical protein [Methylorubrum populi]BAU93352.1 Na/Pi-cotransporter [Methylorubrum populi]
MPQEQLPPITVATPAAAATVTTTIVKRRPFKIVLLNAVNAIATTALAVLGYLQTINLNGIVSAEAALWWMVGINVLTIILRQWFSPSETVQTTVHPSHEGP